MSDRPHDVSYELGGIKQQLETITKTLSEDRMASAAYRTDIRAEIGRQRDIINVVATDVAFAKKDISDMKPKVESLDQRALMSKGAASFAIILGKAAQFVWAGIGAVVVLLIDRLIFHKP